MIKRFAKNLGLAAVGLLGVTAVPAAVASCADGTAAGAVDGQAVAQDNQTEITQAQMDTDKNRLDATKRQMDDIVKYEANVDSKLQGQSLGTPIGPLTYVDSLAAGIAAEGSVSPSSGTVRMRQDIQTRYPRFADGSADANPYSAAETADYYARMQNYYKATLADYGAGFWTVGQEEFDSVYRDAFDQYLTASGKGTPSVPDGVDEATVRYNAFLFECVNGGLARLGYDVLACAFHNKFGAAVAAAGRGEAQASQNLVSDYVAKAPFVDWLFALGAQGKLTGNLDAYVESYAGLYAQAKAMAA